MEWGALQLLLIGIRTQTFDSSSMYPKWLWRPHSLVGCSKHPLDLTTSIINMNSHAEAVCRFGDMHALDVHQQEYSKSLLRKPGQSLLRRILRKFTSLPVFEAGWRCDCTDHAIKKRLVAMHRVLSGGTLGAMPSLNRAILTSEETERVFVRPCEMECLEALVRALKG